MESHVRVRLTPRSSRDEVLGLEGEVLRTWSIMPTFAEEPPAYVDWEAEVLFSLDERGEGECAV